MKIISLLTLFLLISLAACATKQAAPTKVGYQQLSRSLQTGQRLEVENINGDMKRIQVQEFSGDIITARDLTTDEIIEVDINLLTRIRLLK